MSSRCWRAVLATMLASACVGEPASEQVITSEADVGAATIDLLASLDPSSLELPPHSRPHAPAPPERIPLDGWKKDGDAYTTALPFRPRSFYFTRPAPGSRVIGPDGAEVPHRYLAGQARPFWTYDADSISLVGLKSAPGDGEYLLAYPKATEREANLNLDASGKRPEEFAVSSALIGQDTRRGLMLPAPGTATWNLTVPPRASLRFTATMVRPEIADAAPSDGAKLRVHLSGASLEATEVWAGQLDADTIKDVSIDLAAYAGQTITLRIQSEPGAHNRFDYVFLAEPVVATRKVKPKRVFLVFIDTLRPDHLQSYGYERPTSPRLLEESQRGVVFENARSIAPWTLPSTRTMITGLVPERWEGADTVQARFNDAGFATAMFAGNLYLGPNFGIDRDWDLHHAELLPHATDQIAGAMDWLEAHADRDVFMLLHLMDAHLPYKEPASYRNQFASERPKQFKNHVFHRHHVVRARLKPGAERQYIRDRYDANIRYIDDSLAPIYDALGPDDVLMVLSDHGEEFWEHGGYEHGHTLFDEVLRIPLILKAPGLAAGSRVAAPVTMLDVAPTLLDLNGLPHDDLEGVSLVAAAQRDGDAISALEDRTLAFGRPLYGKERWGSLSGDTKYSVIAAREAVYDLSSDPQEKTDLIASHKSERAALRKQLGEALDRPVVPAYRLSNLGQSRFPEHPLVIEITVPGGIRDAWVGEDPTRSSLALVEWVRDDTARIQWPTSYRGPRTVWVAPKKALAEVTHGIKLDVTVGDIQEKMGVPATAPPNISIPPKLLLTHATGSRRWELGFGVTPLPLKGGTELSGYDPETADMLKAMGYVVGDDDPPPVDDEQPAP